MTHRRLLHSICVLAVGSTLTLAERASAWESLEEDIPESAEDDSAGQREPYPLSAGARAFLAPSVGIGGMGVGLDVAYSILPYLAVGAQHVRFVVDQGADPQYCVRCIQGGHSTFAFTEGRFWTEGWATPYARLGLGLSHLEGQRVQYEQGYTENDFSLCGEAGIDWHYRFVSLRTFAFDHIILASELDSDPFLGFGAQLGARF